MNLIVELMRSARPGLVLPQMRTNREEIFEPASVIQHAWFRGMEFYAIVKRAYVAV